MHVFKVTKYDPAHFADGYFGPLDIISDHGPLEAAYLTAVETFAAETGVTSVMIREPGAGGRGGLEPAVEGDGLAGLFPPDLTGYHDGARVPISTAVALVRAMLRDNGAWCRLEDEVVWEDQNGLITRDVVHAEDRPALAVELTLARGAAVRSLHEAEPLAEAVLPDDDGVVRVRWSK
ncbi:hypothetical protein LX88_000058 [Lentzea californiensis]|nr:hypothetical protein [Lentzea californiensis]